MYCRHLSSRLMWLRNISNEIKPGAIILSGKAGDNCVWPWAVCNPAAYQMVQLRFIKQDPVRKLETKELTFVWKNSCTLQKLADGMNVSTDELASFLTELTGKQYDSQAVITNYSLVKKACVKYKVGLINESISNSSDVDSSHKKGKGMKMRERQREGHGKSHEDKEHDKRITGGKKKMKNIEEAVITNKLLNMMSKNVSSGEKSGIQAKEEDQLQEKLEKPPSPEREPSKKHVFGVAETDTVKNKQKPKRQKHVPKLVPRPPVVTIMGHVDHGKTTLLDTLRKSRIVDMEFGGITQHIGAFNVQLTNGQSITFLDTPGHAAFMSMRARGAAVTDIVILVIAAEDGVMQQTVESIQHAQAAKVPLIIAINKIDRKNANVERVKHMLGTYGVYLEEFGGDVQAVPISALKGINLDKLQECILTLSEVLELKGDVAARAKGVVIETRTSVEQGKSATVLVRQGTLKKGDYLICGTAYTKVRSMKNSMGQTVHEATPSMPVEIGGWKDMPIVGEPVKQYDSEREVKKAVIRLNEAQLEEKEMEASKIVEKEREKEREKYVACRQAAQEYFRKKTEASSKHQLKRYGGWRHISRINKYLIQTNQTGNNTDDETDEKKPEFSVIVKGDVAGSVEAIMDTLATFHSDLCDLNIIEFGVGDVTENDVELASTFNADIYAFNVKEKFLRKPGEEGPSVKHHNVIYSLFSDLIQTISEQLPMIKEENVIGEAIVQQPFTYTENKQKIQIAGSKCVSGQLLKNKLFRLIRGDQVLFDGSLLSLKHVKQEVTVITTGQECGMCLDQTLESQPNDVIICYEILEKEQMLDWEPEFGVQS